MTRISRALLEMAVVVLCVFTLTGVGFAQDAQYEQRVEIPASFNPVGSGARALGMGGAFIAVADDATSASWNPGGLIQLELPEVSAVGALVHRVEENDFGRHPEADGAETVDITELNYFSAAYPFTIRGYNMIVSLNYQHLYDLTRQWSFPLAESSADGYLRQNVEYRQEGGLSALGLAYCIQITPALSAGLTLNIWDDDLTPNDWEQTTWQWGRGRDFGDDFVFTSRLHERYSLSGINANLGVLWRVGGGLTLGAVIKTPFDADVTHEQSLSTSIRYANPLIPESVGSSGRTDDATLSMPLSVGIGAAWRISDRLSLSLDLYRTEWGDFEYVGSDGRAISPINGAPAGSAGIDATHQVRAGAEYLVIRPKYVVPIRGGLFYDPAPAPGSPDDFYGYSLGTGIGYDRYIFDIAYQARFGSGVGGAGLEELGLSQDISEHTLYASLILHF